MKKMILPVAMLLTTGAYSQGFVNGSFESTSSTGCDYNKSIAAFNAVMDNVVMFSGWETDIHQNGCYVTPIPDGVKAVGIAYGSPDRDPDGLNLELTDPLIAGQEYVLTFWKHANSYTGTSGNLELGATEDSGVMGTIIGTVAPGIMGIWEEATVTFTAPNNATHISIRNEGLGYWNQIDDFSIELACESMTASVSATEVCAGEMVTLDITASIGGTISWDGGITDGVAFTPPVGTTTYTASSDDPEDCQFSVDIIVNDLPEVTASVDDDEVCLGDDVTFTGGGADSYEWDMGVSDGEAFTPGTGTETYTVTGTDENGCENEASVEVTVYELPTITASVDEDEICLGDDVIFTGDGGETYEWDMGITDGLAYTPGAEGTETYTVTGTDENGCENEASIDVTVLPLPLVTASVDDDLICLGDGITLTGAGADTYSWDMGVTDGVEFTPGEIGTITFTVTGMDAEGCENTATVDVEVSGSPVVNASSGDENYCDGDAIVLAAGGDADIFTWEPLDLTPPVGVTTYTLTGVYEESGCSTVVSLDITVHELPNVVANADDDVICIGMPVVLTGSGATIYSWDPVDVEDGYPYLPMETGIHTFTVTGTDENGCENMDMVDVTVTEEITIDYVTTDEIAGGDGEINITISGGAPAYVFDWDNDGTGDFDDTEDLTGLTAGVYTVVVEGEAGCSASADIWVNGQLGVEELTSQTVKLYPNPATNFITIDNSGAFTYSLFDISGKLILTGEATDQEKLSLEMLPAGVYFVTIYDNQKVETVPFVKD